MTRIFLSFFLFLFALLGTPFAGDQADKALNEVSDYLKALDGIIVESDNSDEVIIDLGSEKGVIKGLELNVFEHGDEIIHPITGKSLGRKIKEIGKVTVVNVNKNYSIAKYKGDNKPAKGNFVGVILPVGVKLKFDNVTGSDRAVIENGIMANPIIKEGNDFILNLSRQSNVLTYSLVQNGTPVLSGAVHKQIQQSFSAIETVGDYEITGGKYFSIARGRFFKGNNKYFLAAATGKNIVILDPDNSYKPVDQVKHSFNTLVNIEAGDLDGNGVDELFVSNVIDGKFVKSLVFEHDGVTFKPVAKDLDFLFRSYTSHGVRKIIGQRIAVNGGYQGEIFHVDFYRGNYAQGSVIKGTVGRQLMGFTIINDSQDPLMASISRDNTLQIFTFKKPEYSSSSYYGDTFHYIYAVASGSKASGFGKEKEVGPDSDKYLYIYPRVNVIDDKYLVIAENTLRTRIFVRTQLFNESYLHLLSYQYGTLKSVAKSAELQPVIVDTWTYNEAGVNYIAALISTDSKLFNSSASNLIVFRVNI